MLHRVGARYGRRAPFSPRASCEIQCIIQYCTILLYRTIQGPAKAFGCRGGTNSVGADAATARPWQGCSPPALQPPLIGLHPEKDVH